MHSSKLLVVATLLLFVACFDIGHGIDTKDDGATESGRACDAPKTSALLTVFIVVVTAPQNRRKRDLIRRAWFSTGRGGTERWKARFFVGGDPAAVVDEDDVVVLNVKDGPGYYQELWEKVKAAFAWSFEHEPAHYYMKVDDDVFVDTASLVWHLEARRSSSAGREYFGSPRSSVVDRNPTSSAYVPVDAFEETTWPDYCQGIHYALSSDLVEWLTANKDELRSPGGVAGEDVTMALTLRSVGVIPEDVPYMFYVQAGRWLDGIPGEPEPEAVSGCLCTEWADKDTSFSSANPGPAVVGLDSTSEDDLERELSRLVASNRERNCACHHVPPHWIRNEALRRAYAGDNCGSKEWFTAAEKKCRDQRICSDDLVHRIAIGKNTTQQRCLTHLEVVTQVLHDETNNNMSD